ncbi:MAG TPA: uridine kinase [Anaerolineae bacterium]|nr:uridine kinase [Anaerolineae bacterium]HOQ99838.1 uridine kinase [Anaerolineae bacterium]HPL30003.1 uridine kinase [Anaerolineae bacterium]
MRKPFVIGIAGGSASGKSTVVHEIVKALGDDDVLVLMHDSYYRDRSDVPLEVRRQANYDHPEALETSLMVAHLEQLLRCRSADLPVYDFATYTRRPEPLRVQPRQVIIVEGILVLADERLRSFMDIKVFVEADADVRFIRRLQRDVQQRGRSVDSVIEQYLRTVRPMHLEFVEPSKRYADIIIPVGGYNAVGVDMLVTKIKASLEERRREA